MSLGPGGPQKCPRDASVAPSERDFVLLLIRGQRDAEVSSQTGGQKVRVPGCVGHGKQLTELLPQG